MPPSQPKQPQEQQNKPNPNTFGSDLWIRNPQQQRRATSGRGLFAGLQDVKSYDVDQGWARRHSSTPAGNSSTGSGFLGVLGRWVWGGN